MLLSKYSNNFFVIILSYVYSDGIAYKGSLSCHNRMLMIYAVKDHS
ncbi:hypothetical protein M069_5206 [Bacteroides fragilis str. B1 (UDC16-1)]|nr:hypothetical protein M069_5206 [Bacteroides fragilis str. B1 (UDC16-1)]